MTTKDRYAYEPEETQWDVSGSFDTAFRWEYEDGTQALLDLYAKGKNLQWDAARRIDWSIDLDPENPQQLPDHAVAIYGSDICDDPDPSEPLIHQVIRDALAEQEQQGAQEGDQ